MTFKLIHGKGPNRTPRIPKDDEIEELLRDSIRLAKAPKQHRLGQLVETEISDGILIEVFQTGIRSFYVRTSNATPNQHGGQKRREKGALPTKVAALMYGRMRARERRRFADRHPARPEDQPLRHKRPRRRRYLATADVTEVMMPVIEQAIARDAAREVQGTEASCPVCTRIVARDNMALHSHLMAHVRKKLITREQKKEIQASLQRKRGPRAA